MDKFVKIMNAKEFDIHTRHVPFGIRFLVARYWHDDRYLTGSVNVHTRIGKFIRKKTNSRDEVIKIYYYGYELLIEPITSFSWRFIRGGEDLPDLIPLALAADPNPIAGPDERLFYGKVYIDGISHYGQVRADGKCYVVRYFSSMHADIVLTFKNFYILECANQKPETSIFAPDDLQNAQGNTAPYFQPIREAEDFDSLVPEAFRNLNCELVARLRHRDRYLPGFVDINTRVGVFIDRNEVQQHQVIINDDYGYDLLVNWIDKLGWEEREEHDEGDHVDLTNAFPADPEAPELLYYAQCNPVDDNFSFGLLYEDGNFYVHFADEVLIWNSCFEVLEYKQPQHQ